MRAWALFLALVKSGVVGAVRGTIKKAVVEAVRGSLQRYVFVIEFTIIGANFKFLTLILTKIYGHKR